MSAGARIAVIAALPRELRALVKGSAPDAALLARGVHLHRLGNAVIVCAGMGAVRAALAFEAALACGSIELVLSAGLAGSCTDALQPGEVREAGLIIHALTGERFSCQVQDGDLILATTAAIASVGEKARLAMAYRAAMVDMEAATLARLARAHGLPFRAVKGISDAHDFELASLSRFEGKHGQFRTAAFAFHTALRPHHWRPAAKLGRESNRALGALTARLQEILLEVG